MSELEFIDAHDERILIHGRTDMKQEIIPIFWTGAGAEFITDSSTVSLIFETDFEIREQWIRVTMDDVTFLRMPLNRGRQTVCLYRGMPKGAPKKIRFYKENQSTELDPRSILLFVGIECDGKLYKAELRKRKIEVIGDSVSSGEGVIGPSSLVGGLPTCFSTENHYVVEMCKRLNADFRIMSQSGWGVAYSWNNMPSHTMPPYYREICSIRQDEYYRKYGGEKQNDFESYKPDIIVVHLGNNDVFAMKEDSYIDPQTGHEYRMNADADGRVSMESAKDVTEAVCNFLKVLRKFNPGAKLIWIYGMFGTELEEAIEKGVDKFNSEEAIICGAINMKQKADYIRIPFANASDYGSNNHPGQKAHLKLGEFLAGKLECFFEKD